MSIKVTGRSRTQKIKVNRDIAGGFRDITALDRRVWCRYEAY